MNLAIKRRKGNVKECYAAMFSLVPEIITANDVNVVNKRGKFS